MQWLVIFPRRPRVSPSNKAIGCVLCVVHGPRGIDLLLHRSVDGLALRAIRSFFHLFCAYFLIVE